jgi:hypothetical protein
MTILVIHYRHDFVAFSASGSSNLRSTAPDRGKPGIDMALRFVDLALFAQHVGKVYERSADHFALAPMLKTSPHRFVMRIRRRQHMPLRPGVEEPQRRIEHPAGWNRFAPTTIVRKVLLRKNGSGSASTARSSSLPPTDFTYEIALTEFRGTF